jgi:sensor histidine kinase YesM
MLRTPYAPLDNYLNLQFNLAIAVGLNCVIRRHDSIWTAQRFLNLSGTWADPRPHVDITTNSLHNAIIAFFVLFFFLFFLFLFSYSCFWRLFSPATGISYFPTMHTMHPQSELQ